MRYGWGGGGWSEGAWGKFESRRKICKLYEDSIKSDFR